MKVVRSVRSQPWKIGVASVTGLLLALLVGGLVVLVITTNVTRVAESALGYDVELEDNADDLRAAVLDVRHFHRNLFFAGPSRQGLADFEGAYATLLGEIDELAELGVRDPEATQPAELRRMAEAYYATFRPAVDRYASDRAAFDAASDAGLVALEGLERAAQEIDRLGEERATRALTEVDEASIQARVILIGVLLGLLLAGVVLGFVMVRVLRELQRLYGAQQLLAGRLRESLQAKADFIADVSHELRTPLTVLRGNAEIGLAIAGGPEHREILTEIVQETTRMSRLIEDLLLLARSDARTLRFDLAVVAVEPWLAEISARAEVLAREHGAPLRTVLGADGEARVDAARIEQAVLILVDNAAKFGPPGEEVTLRTRAEGGRLVIEVADRGPGIPEEEIPLIFERYHRAERSSSRQHGGTGLGLSIARSIVEGHGGTVEVRSAVGRGTVMAIRLPLVAHALGPDSGADGPRAPVQEGERGEAVPAPEATR